MNKESMKIIFPLAIAVMIASGCSSQTRQVDALPESEATLIIEGPTDNLNKTSLNESLISPTLRDPKRT